LSLLGNEKLFEPQLPAGDAESLLTIVKGLMTIVNPLIAPSGDHAYQYWK